MNNVIRFIFIGLALCISACDGGGGGSGPPDKGSSDIGSPVSVQAGGIWLGTLQFNWAADSTEAIALVADTRRFQVVATNSDIILSSTFVIRETPFQGAGQFFWANTFAEPFYTDPVIFWGDVVSRGSLSMIWSGGWDTPAGDLEFSYQADLYERPSSLEYLTGSWTGPVDNGNPWVGVTIGADGSIAGMDDRGCTSDGRIAVLNSNYNLYEVLDMVSNCDAGDEPYTGLAYLFDVNDVPNSGLLLSVDNGSEARWLSVIRD